MYEMRKTLVIATLLCMVTATSAFAAGPANGEWLDGRALANTSEIEEPVVHIDPTVLNIGRDLDVAGTDAAIDFDETELFPTEPARSATKSLSGECITRAAQCAYNSTDTTLACAATILDFGTTAIDCVYDMSTGATPCAQANDVCPFGNGQPLSSATQNVGTTSGTSTTKTCGVPDRVREAYFGWQPHHYTSVDTITKIRLVCTDGGVMDFGSNFGTNGLWGAYCGAGNQMPGFDFYYGSQIHGAAPWCDDVTTTSGADWYGLWRGSRTGSFKSLKCPEGKYVYGMSTHSDSNYINGLYLICRP